MTHTSGITSADWEGGPVRRAYVERGIQDRRSPGGLAGMVRRLATLPLLQPARGEPPLEEARIAEPPFTEPPPALSE